MTQIRIQRRVAAAGVPSSTSLRTWAQEALSRGGRRRPRGLTIRIVDEAESRALNARYRRKNKPTNVLSFPYPDLPGAAAELGDLVICAAVVRREAAEQGKPPRSHWAHMVVHGVLHLLGYDHARPRDAAAMEARERAILRRFAIADPYTIPGAAIPGK